VDTELARRVMGLEKKAETESGRLRTEDGGQRSEENNNAQRSTLNSQGENL